MSEKELLLALMDEMKVMRKEMDEKFTSIDQRLENMDQRLDNMDQRLDVIDERLDNIEEDTKITREAVNSLIEWADEVAVISHVKFPVKKAR